VGALLSSGSGPALRSEPSGGLSERDSAAVGWGFGGAACRLPSGLRQSPLLVWAGTGCVGCGGCGGAPSWKAWGFRPSAGHHVDVGGESILVAMVRVITRRDFRPLERPSLSSSRLRSPPASCEPEGHGRRLVVEGLPDAAGKGVLRPWSEGETPSRCRAFYWPLAATTWAGF